MIIFRVAHRERIQPANIDRTKQNIYTYLENVILISYLSNRVSVKKLYRLDGFFMLTLFLRKKVMTKPGIIGFPSEEGNRIVHAVINSGEGKSNEHSKECKYPIRIGTVLYRVRLRNT